MVRLQPKPGSTRATLRNHFNPRIFSEGGGSVSRRPKIRKNEDHNSSFHQLTLFLSLLLIVLMNIARGR